MIAANSLASRFISRKLKSPQVRRHGPDDDDIHTLCPSCGQLYRNADIERDGEAPISDNQCLRTMRPAGTRPGRN